MRLRCCLCVCIFPVVARQLLGKSPLIVTRQQLGKNSPLVASQRLSEKITAVTNTHATIEEFLDTSFSMWSVSYQGK
jgi:hypothetical protein